VSSILTSRPLHEARLYGIVDLAYVAAVDACDVTEKLIAGGVDLVQLRAKDFSKGEIERIASKLREVTAAARVPLIVNDHAEIAQRVSANGVHIGQDDGLIAVARRGASATASANPAKTAFLVGRSTHSFDQAVCAQQEGADYIGFGPLFPTPTKAGRPAIGLTDIARVQRTLRIPVFCIGGIDVRNLQAVLDAGARRVVIVSAILRAADIMSYCRDVKAALSGCPL